MAAATTALAVGGFAIGTAEFVSMGLLPEIARGVGVSIPQAGHVISAYALGVVVGAPLIAVLGARLPRRALLLGLATVFTVGNTVAAAAPDYGSLVLSRFVAGLPHGAYFGLASLVAASLVPPSRRGRAVSRVLLGLPVATLVGVPLATFLGQQVGWRAAYVVVSVVGLVTVVLVRLAVPEIARDGTASGRRELRAFREPQVWFTLAIGGVGFGGMFAMYSYIAPVVTDVTGQRPVVVPLFLFVFGVGSLLGTAAGGPLADRSVSRSMVASLVTMGVGLALFGLVAGSLVPALVLGFAVPFVSSVLVLSLQLRLMHVAGEAQNIGAALNHASLNAANALGAYLGGVVIAVGYGLRAPSFVGAGLCLGGLVIALVALAADRRPSRVAVPALTH